MSSTMKTKASSKAAFKLGSPYTETKWPVLSSSTQDAILRLLLELLTPIGRYRKDHVTTSKGKQHKKRKRVEQQDGGAEKQDEADLVARESASSSKPPRPVIEEHITIGFNSTTRSLEDTLQRSKAMHAASEGVDSRMDDNSEKKSRVDNTDEPTKDHDKKLAVIFLTHPTDYLPYRQLPNLTEMIAKCDSTARILFVPLSETSDAKLSAALGIPRVGVIGIYEYAPGATALLQYTHENVPPVNVPWIQEAEEGKWLGSQIQSKTRESNKR